MQRRVDVGRRMSSSIRPNGCWAWLTLIASSTHRPRRGRDAHADGDDAQADHRPTSARGDGRANDARAAGRRTTCGISSTTASPAVVNRVVATTASTERAHEATTSTSTAIAAAMAMAAKAAGLAGRAAAGDLHPHHAEQGHRQEVRADEMGELRVLGAEGVEQERAGEHGADDGDADADGRRQPTAVEAA